MGFGSFKSNNPFRHSSSAQSNNNDIGDVPPPPGPPPSHRPAAASGAGSSEQYAPPPGPPPSYSQGKGKYNHDDDLFSGWDSSPSTNAPEEQAEAGEAWCRNYPLSPPTDLTTTDPSLRQASLIPRLIAPPPGVFSKGSSLTQTGPGAWTVRTDRRAGDCCIIGYPHAYLVQRDSPLATGRARTVYFECRVGEMGRDAGLAVGFQALPYPPFRMPGWHRGSLAVHGDDGHKYVNDRWGGKDFTEPFRKGEVVGIGMVFSPGGGGGGGGGGGLSSSGGKGKGKGSGGGGEPGMIQVEVFFTRGGRETGRWDMHESLDSETDLPITGLEGYHDLTVAIGTYGSVGAEVVLDPNRWVFKP
ncbi:Protein ssh4 [Cytospora mali]|uniref:Protein ssh4 n=1 Tax=Cytospora mali TaxID=578113 RepID=A0A194VGQ4_CYTMA|nr:Protein ssh4 [Valsa mali var. pyri (nom. inval.)]